MLYQAQGRYDEAEPLFRRSLAIREKALGPDHPDVGIALNNLAELYTAQTRYGEAESHHKRALGIWENALGPDHPSVATSLSNLAAVSAERGDADPALIYQRRATAILIRRAQARDDRGEGSKLELAKGGESFRFHVFAADRAGGDRSAILPESFEMALWALQTEAADALAQMSARFAAGGGALAEAVRERQDLVARRLSADGRLVAAAGTHHDKARTRWSAHPLSLAHRGRATWRSAYEWQPPL